MDNLQEVVRTIRHNLAIACGGWSQYSPAALACALRGQLNQGMLSGATPRDAIGEALRQEEQRWQEYYDPAWGRRARIAFNRDTRKHLV